MKRRAWLCTASLTLLLAACAKDSGSVLPSGLSETGQIEAGTATAEAVQPTESESLSPKESLAASKESRGFCDLATAVSQSILKENKDRFLAGECMAEGHTILGTEEEGEQVTVYLLAMFGWYQFQDGNFVKSSGSGIVPTVMTFKQEQDGAYLLNDYQTAQDGSLYNPSVMELFPEEFWESCISPSAEDMEALIKQERTYAAAYLKELGRNAEIGD